MSLLELAKWVGWILATIGGFAVLCGQAHHPVLLKNRQAVWVFGAAWSAVLLLEYYALGPASYISMSLDGNIGPTFYTYLTDRHLGGQLAHAYGGGHDIGAVLGFGTQYFSIERTLFALLPTWLAILALKVCATGVGFSGAYKLCRVAGGFDRTLSASLAALFTVTLFYLVIFPTWHGLGYSVLPWVIYLGVVRGGRRFYLPGILALGIITSTAEPTHTFVAIVAILVAGAVMLGKVSLRTFILPLVSISVFMVANWHEVFYAMLQIAPLTPRGSASFSDLNLIEILGYTFLDFTNLKTITVGIVVSVLVLAYRRDPFFRSAAGAIVALLSCYFALVWLPWESFGLGIVKGLNPHYLYYANTAVCLLIFGKAVESLETGGGMNLGFVRFDRRWPTALIFAAVAAMLVSFKVESIAKYVYYGGQSQYSTIENLANPDWVKPEPFRVVTLRHHRPEPEIVAAFYGLDNYDGILKLTSKDFVSYWRDGILKGEGQEGILTRLALERRHFSGAAYDIDNQADLSLLGVANVAFIISPVPLKGGVRLVSGPDRPPARSSDGLTTLAADRLSRIVRYGKVYVYVLPDFLPRAFAARAIHRVGAEEKEAGLLEIISTLAPARTAVVRGAPEILSHAGDLKTMRVVDLSKTVNGYDVAVDAPDGGVLVLNVPPMPFWTAATAAGQPLKVSTVNMVHMAVVVPVGTRSVSFRYRRPTLRSVVKELLQ